MLGAIDFTAIEVWTKSGLVNFYLLFVMEVATRRVHFAGCITSPEERWMKQVARNLTDPVDGFLAGTRYVLLDRMFFFGEASLRKATVEFLSHFHGERNHQGLKNRLIRPGEEISRVSDPIHCRKQLDGMLRYHYRAAPEGSILTPRKPRDALTG